MLKCYESSPIFIAIFLFFFFPVVLLSCVSKEQYNLKEPKASNDIYMWDFGQVKEGEVLEHSFILRNSKDKPVVIVNMHTSCGCTVSETQKKHLLPGEYTQINVKFHTQGYSGKVEQYVYVHTDDVSVPIIKFSVKAEVVK
jgi:hypothetical protein